MKKQKIQNGRKYTDGKGNVREIIGSGKPYFGQHDSDVVRFKVLKKFKGPQIVGREYDATRTSFAAWAKSEIV